MRSIFDARERQRLLRRLDTLTPCSRARWGQMRPSQMVCHLIDALDSSSSSSSEGPSPATPARGPLTFPPIRWLVINVLPWPKGKLQSPPELFVTTPSVWPADVARLRSSLERVAARGPGGEWPASDVFGRLSGRQWGALLRTHIDHHLRQFGA